MPIPDQQVAAIRSRLPTAFAKFKCFGIWAGLSSMYLRRGSLAAATYPWPVFHSFGRAVIALMIGSCVPIDCAAGPVIWFKLTMPPGVIARGPEQGQGYTDQLVAAVLHNLPQYPVTITSVPIARELQMMKEGGPYCASDLLKTPERENFLRFTGPYGYVLPIGLVVRAEDRGLYDR